MRSKILRLLEGNSRLSAKEIAVMLGLPPDQVAQEISRMEEERIILGYSTLINWEKAGEEQVAALIDVKVAPQQDVGFDEVAARIYRYPEVKSVFLMSGGYDLSVLVQGKSLKEVADFVARKLATLEHVQSTVTHFILKRYKQDGIIFDDPEADRRQVVQP
ncbi:MAG: Lrp/AsnC family transcriptional regulator [Thermoanaerobacteraceae bacterium]|uniref:Lrp/AsnC family transcriptional regulator n=1 Tax=Thermanaeromonas sp. C210 TaxID=2731925 RepID=UPI00155CCB8F|nr:Lrp/AsnC family transcriptional regulator [Thermanaeromonas sp. C210]MBE3582189.1 Lrp/AsnC family transcriptional regulator [Thermoanaerobacteraceae bacterium]GFN23613.1 AsnC family transcriptional regulator [Thermanaeromonas sp. C210]